MQTSMNTCEAPETHRTLAHIKACPGCRHHWPMIASVLDTMDDTAVRHATIGDVLERGMM